LIARHMVPQMPILRVSRRTKPFITRMASSEPIREMYASVFKI
jgi:hypothetical protein